MSAVPSRTRLGRIFLIVLIASTGVVAWNWSTLRAKYLGYQLRTANSLDERKATAHRLLALGEPGQSEMIAHLQRDEVPICSAIAATLNEHLSRLTRTSEPFVSLSRTLLESSTTYSDAGQESLLELLPTMLKSADAAIADHGRKAIERGLKSSTGAKVRAVRLASRHELNLLPTILPLLADPEPEVRATVLKTIGILGERAAVNDEELFRWLNDSNENVRTICEAVLESRGRTQDEIDLGRQLTHPNPRVRLQLLVDLPLEPNRDIGPWLERLSRDAEPAVRAGAVRVASERKLLYSEWADRLAASDPDATVRQVATFHRRRAAGLTAVGGFGP